jgi:hypothetical protein
MVHGPGCSDQESLHRKGLTYRADTYALGVLAELSGLDTPIVVIPLVNSSLAGRDPFRGSVE